MNLEIKTNDELIALNAKWQAALVATSIVAHVVALSALSYVGDQKLTKPHKPLQVKVVINELEIKPEPTSQAVPPKPKPEKPQPRPKDKIATQTQKSPADPSAKPVTPVQGLSKESVSSEGSGMSAPVGNTTMMADQGQRMRPEDIAALKTDLSAEASVIRETVANIQYTQGALDAGVEGTFVVDVYVDESGKVTEAELRKKIGYGMDDKLIDAAHHARFSPRKNPLGLPIAGWTSIKFKLIIP